MAGAADDEGVVTRYRVNESEGSWWEVGWNAQLGTFYARHFEQTPDPDNHRLVEWIGTEFTEIGTVTQLRDRIGVTVPPAVRVQLDADRSVRPFPGMPASLRALEAAIRPAESGLIDPHTEQSSQYAIVTGYQRTDPTGQRSPSVPQGEPDAHFEGTEAPTSYGGASSVSYTTYRQVTRPSIYPPTLISDARAGDGVDPCYASAAHMRVIDPDRGTARPAERIDLVRVSSLTEDGWWGGHDIWLTWQASTTTWEHTDDPRHHGALDPGPHIPPESWTLEREEEAIEAFDITSIEPLAHDPSETEYPANGLDLE
ncbi:MAG: hypothetical protein ACRD2C_16235 [Acidimicrobiales bacterium]